MQVSVAENSGAARTGTVTIAGQTLTVNQAGPPCEYTVQPRDIEPGALGGIFLFQVRADAGCSWTAVSDEPWIRVLFGASGSGNGQVTLLVAPNTDRRKRKGEVTVENEKVKIEQDGPR